MTYLQPSRCGWFVWWLNNTNSNVYGAILMTKVIARVHPVHLMNVDWATGDRQPPAETNRLQFWVRRKCFSYHPQLPSPLLLLLSPTKGERLSRPMHCSKGVQPVPEAVYRSGCRDKRNCQQCDSNLGPLTPQSDALTTRPLRAELSV